ncbi:hypothetical protein ES705_45978 [subsurface metagenome]
MRCILDEHTFSVLEFSKIKKQLKEKISTSTGELIVENITPKIDLPQISNTQRETTEMREIISYDGTPPFSRLETKEKYPLIRERTEKIQTFSELEKEIIQCISLRIS